MSIPSSVPPRLPLMVPKKMTTDSQTGLPPTILVADDDPDTRIIVSSVVSILGYTARVVADGDEAVAACGETLPSLAILDFMMPGMTGLEVCRQIKSLPGGEFVPVVMLTARDGLRDKVNAFEEGVDDYLTKPFHYQELQARIRALLRLRELTISLREKNDELKSMQERLIEKERQAVVGQLAGTAAHELGQPLSAILLNCYLLENLPSTDVKFQSALHAIKVDTKRMAEILDRLKGVDAAKKQSYYGSTEILTLEK